jgi:PAS domain S-box-containing protein
MGKPLRVLIVEDVPDDAELLVLELRRAGYDPVSERVETAAGMRAALERGGWDFILSDNSLPQFDAAAALRLLRELDVDLPFIVVSGSIGEDVAVALMKAGAHDYLLKGHLARLGAAVERELREAEHRRERRRAEDNLRRSERRLAEAERLAQLGNWERDVRTNIVTASEELRQIFGLDPGESGDTVEAYRERIHPEDRALVAELTERALQDHKPFSCEHRIVRPDGAVRTVHSQGRLVLGDGGTPVRMVGTVQDITDRAQLENQFRQAQRMEAVGRLAGGVAHDFNNLLTVINSYSEFLLEDLDAEDHRRHDVEEIRKAGVSAAALTRQLLAFSRQQVLQPQILDPSDVLAKAESLLKRMIGEDVEVVMALAPQLGTVRADPGQVEQVIMNLAVNARDAMPEGGRLTIETANVEMDEAYLRNHAVGSPGRYVMLAVTDTGVGMDETTQAHIFEPFFTTKETGKGTGLGLATVYGVVKQSGGFIWVYSEPGHGTTFKIYLPRVDEPAQSLTGPDVTTKSLRGVETVLLVEDAVAVRAVARHTLERQGYTVLEASNGAAALRLAAEHPGTIQLVVTDVVMPGMNGRQFAEQLAAARPSLKVLYTSGYTDDAVVRHGVLESGVQFLQKPFTPDALARKVREVLDSRPAS